ncbi:class II histone deacetylase [Kaistia dalseonensis]|uniref:Acetoin utilization deacetylase AcuC-like enzyme n=1 Tax=Kaistia dalseonensis TaxID=410840 RepID=A0ABU0H4Y9_9HYPH|nr:class II histone deacetylase [Kaistia dalseonensis]MCX5494351.1 class II histone deacetylase [Kaistia dalseonensis]MDQ0436933.1 acetoin utilization deacetylase AcuC-like enzyme [Kaistia dalseonensis]
MMSASVSRLPTGLVWHELLMWHDTNLLAGFLKAGRGVVEPDEPSESAASKRRIKNLLDVAGLTEQLAWVKPRPATDAELTRVHAPAYLRALRKLSAGDGGDASLGAFGGDTPFGPGGFEIGILAAGGMLEAVDAIVEGRIANAYALVRPPGHHAVREHGFGFCMFNHGALAARHAQEKHGLKRIAIVDWDVHHGNGAEQIFWEDPSVFTLSIHQDGAYPPRSGPIDARGAGAGFGANLNVPLPPGSGVGAYEAVMDRVVIPALHRFKPDMIIVACGFDAGAYDPQARMMLHSDAFRGMTRRVMEAADTLCGGRLLLTHEGGYHRPSVPFYGLAVVEQLSGLKGTVEDIFVPMIEAMAYQALQPHQDAVIAAAERLVADIGQEAGSGG